jgi:hypothetical protein
VIITYGFVLLAVAWQIVTVCSGSPFVADAIVALPPTVAATIVATANALAALPRIAPHLSCRSGCEGGIVRFSRIATYL